MIWGLCACDTSGICLFVFVLSGISASGLTKAKESVKLVLGVYSLGLPIWDLDAHTLGVYTLGVHTLGVYTLGCQEYVMLATMVTTLIISTRKIRTSMRKI